MVLDQIEIMKYTDDLKWCERKVELTTKKNNEIKNTDRKG